MCRHYRHKSRRKRCARWKLPRLYRKMVELNSNITLDFKQKVVVSWYNRNCACAVKIRKIDKKRHQSAKISTSYYRKPMSLNPFPVTDLRSEVELMHLLHMRRHYRHVWNTHHWTDSQVRLNGILLSWFTVVFRAKRLAFVVSLLVICFVLSLRNNSRCNEIVHCVSNKVPTFKFSVTLSNLNRFSKFLYCWKAYTICYRTHTTIPTSP